MKHEWMKRIRNATSREELNSIIVEVATAQMNVIVSEETFEAIWNVFWQKKEEFSCG